jgi:phospholipase C
MTDRRTLLKNLMLSAPLSAALGGLHPAIARALDIPAKVRTGTIKDVEHVVILTQENRSFDHYFGALNGVRGFGDRFPIPVADTETRKGKSVWIQPNEKSGDPALIAPFALNTKQTFAHMRVEGTPHTVPDAQDAWDQGRMADWPRAKHNHSMGYFTREDMPFQYALAEAFTLCDAYHCAMHAGTNPNRVFIWTGTNDPLAKGNGPVLTNEYDNLKDDGEGHGGYSWVTYSERLQAAGISWQVYQDMKNNFTDNPLAGFRLYREADKATSGPLVDIANRSVRTRHLDKLREDVLADKLPAVSWIVGPDYGSEHPGPSSPAQGADYTAEVLAALTANPDVWSKTVFLINFDENDGFFDHAPPPAVPSCDPADPSKLLGASNVDTTGEYHVANRLEKYKNRPYGLGPRVPLYVISPWSKGGFVSSELFDHTSCIRFLEARFGIMEPNISPWRRAVCGDLTSCFDFRTPNDQAFFEHLPKTKALAEQAKALGGRTRPPVPATITLPVQEKGTRPKRPTPYSYEIGLEKCAEGLAVTMANTDKARAQVFHLYDLKNLNALPRRYTIAANSIISEIFTGGPDERFDLQLFGPDGAFAHFRGRFGAVDCSFSVLNKDKVLFIRETGHRSFDFTLSDETYGTGAKSLSLKSDPTNADHNFALPTDPSGRWFDVGLRTTDLALRFAGHVPNGKPGHTDPAMFGPARADRV